MTRPQQTDVCSPLVPGELGYDTGPYVAVAAFCDQVIQGNDGVLSLIRLIDTVQVQGQGPDAPTVLPGGVVRTNLVIILRAGEARGAQTVRIALEYPDGSSKSPHEMSVNFAPGPHGGVNIVSPLAFEVASAGLYWADVSINDRLVTRVPLMVQYEFRR